MLKVKKQGMFMVQLKQYNQDIKLKEEFTMRDWNDFNGDGEIDIYESRLTDELLCTSREEHRILFGSEGDYGYDDDDEDYDDYDF